MPQHAVIIVPTYNEKPNIERLMPVLAEVLQGIDGWKLSVLVVDDSSPDGTADAVRALQKRFRFLELLVNTKKSGLGGAYLKGMAHAFEKLKADIVFEFDADLSHDPAKIPEFLVAIESGADLVIGSRYIAGGSIPDNWGLHRKFFSVVGNWIISIVWWSRVVHDWTSGYRAIRRSVYEAVGPELDVEQFYGYTFQIGFLHKALRKGFTVAEVPFHFVDRTEGVSKLGTEYIINTLRYILVARWRELLELRLFKLVIVGGIGFVVNFVFFHLFSFLRLGSVLHDQVLSIAPGSVWDSVLSDQGVAVVASAEVAILSNYLWSNFWTFRDRQIHGLANHIPSFLKLNLSSLGAVFLQYVVMQAGTLGLGIFALVRFGAFSVSSVNLYLVLGVLLGMIWNFTMYSKVIWRKQS